MPDLGSLTNPPSSNLPSCRAGQASEEILRDSMFSPTRHPSRTHSGVRVAPQDLFRLARSLLNRLAYLHPLGGKGGVSC